MNTLGAKFKSRGSHGQRGFTLVEMLIVAALIALFSSLAVFSIQTMYELNRDKSVTAECRQVATAMAFAQNDLGFFPKICFLRFNESNLLQELSGLGFDSLEAYGNPIGNLPSRIASQWKGGYLAGSQPGKTVNMRFTSNGVPKDEPWPADTFGNPYVPYLVHTVAPATGANTASTQRFIQPSDSANFFAGIVSYGRNLFPGSLTTPTDLAAQQRRLNLRLYSDLNFRNYRMLDPYPSADYSAARLQMILTDPLLVSPDGPRIRDAGSDDHFYEF